MKMTSKQVFEATIRSDETITKEQAELVLQVLDGTLAKTGDERSPSGMLLVNQGVGAAMLGVCRQKFAQFVADGRLNPVILQQGREYIAHSRDGKPYKRRSDLIRFKISDIRALAGDIR